MVKPNIKYRVNLTGEERSSLLGLVQKGKTAGCRARMPKFCLPLMRYRAMNTGLMKRQAQLAAPGSGQ
jgi:hypothetical protein